MIEKEGILVKGIGGFYYVDSDNETYECKVRGIFRKRGISPYIGDRVKISVPDNGFATIDEILPRKNSFTRPPMANIDNLIIVASVCDPMPNTLILDKMIAAAVNNDITPIIVISKSDLKSTDEIADIYRNAGIKTICTSISNKLGLSEIKNILPHTTTALIGNTGVGKSSLINALFPEAALETGDISKKLGRGRHTTRRVELFKLGGGYILDTPGFSTMDIEHYQLIEKEKIQYCFNEFNDYLSDCKFSTCSHTCEKGCAVIKAVNDGKISRSRHSNYVAMYNEIKDIKEWQRPK